MSNSLHVSELSETINVLERTFQDSFRDRIGLHGMYHNNNVTFVLHHLKT